MRVYVVWAKVYRKEKKRKEKWELCQIPWQAVEKAEMGFGAVKHPNEVILKHKSNASSPLVKPSPAD